MPVEVKVNNRELHLILRMQSFNYQCFQEVLEAYQSRNDFDTLVFDMRHVQYMDSSGIGVLMSTRKAISSRAVLEIRNCNDYVLKVLKITRMDRVAIIT